MTLEIAVAGETLHLRPDRTLFWPRRRTLLLADPHFGKAAAFRAAGIPLPGDTLASLARLSAALAATGAAQLVILGDFWHARAGCTGDVLEELAAWRAQHSAISIALIRGNHDRAGPPPPTWAEQWHPHSLCEPPFVWSHFPEPSEQGYVLAGHLHPAVRVSGAGRQRLRLPCFWFRPGVAILPAFGTFTGAATVRPSAGERLFVIAEERIFEMPCDATAWGSKLPMTADRGIEK